MDRTLEEELRATYGSFAVGDAPPDLDAEEKAGPTRLNDASQETVRALASSVLASRKAKEFVYKVQTILIGDGGAGSPADLVKAVRGPARVLQCLGSALALVLPFSLPFRSCFFMFLVPCASSGRL